MLKACKKLRATASQSITLWKMDLNNAVYLTFSDCGGVGTEDDGRVQASWISGISDRAVQFGARGKFSPMSWKSNRIKKAIYSTLAGETSSLSSSLGEAQWLSVLIKAARDPDFRASDWAEEVGPFCTVLRDNSDLSFKADQIQVVDAKSVFDVLNKNTAGSQKDRRSAIELAVIRDSFNRKGGTVRWIPHPLMPADIMNKVDLAKGNDALDHLLRTGLIKLVAENEEMVERGKRQRTVGRTKAASKRELHDREEA